MFILLTTESEEIIMKNFTRKLMTMAVCSVMAVTSMVGLSASAGYASTMLEPNGNPKYLTIDGSRYGFQVRSQIETTTLSSGKITGTASTYLYEVNGNTIPSNHIVIKSYISAKNSSGQGFVINGSDIENTPLYKQSDSCVYKTVSSRSYDDYPYYAASGYVNISYGSIGEVATISSGTTAYVN